MYALRLFRRPAYPITLSRSYKCGSPEQLLKISFFLDPELQLPPIPQHQRYCLIENCSDIELLYLQILL